jgi:hypothetical protein
MHDRLDVIMTLSVKHQQHFFIFAPTLLSLIPSSLPTLSSRQNICLPSSAKPGKGVKGGAARLNSNVLILAQPHVPSLPWNIKHTYGEGLWKSKSYSLVDAPKSSHPWPRFRNLLPRSMLCQL